MVHLLIHRNHVGIIIQVIAEIICKDDQKLPGALGILPAYTRHRIQRVKEEMWIHLELERLEFCLLPHVLLMLQFCQGDLIRTQYHQVLQKL